MVKTESKSAVS